MGDASMYKWLMKNFKHMMPAIQMANEKSSMDDASHLNG